MDIFNTCDCDSSANCDENNSVNPPLAEKIPEKREYHGDVFIDNYAWMKDCNNPIVRKYIDAQNNYTSSKVAHLSGLRKKLFQELKSRVQETDMSVPTRMNGYWYYVRTCEGSQYAIQCRIPVIKDDDWVAPVIDEKAEPGTTDYEEVIFDANLEANIANSSFFRLGGMDVSLDGMRMLYGIDVHGDERYDYYIRDLHIEESESSKRGTVTYTQLDDSWKGISSASLSPDGKWVWYVRLDDSWRPYQVFRHKVGEPTSSDVKVYEELDERFWVNASISFDDRYVVICSDSKTTSKVLITPLSSPEDDFRMVVNPIDGVEYDVSFACFEHGGENGEDIPLVIINHNARNPNFEIDVIDMRNPVNNSYSNNFDVICKNMPYDIGDGVCIASGSPYGCEKGDEVIQGASNMPISTPYFAAENPKIMQGCVGLSIDGLSMYKNYALITYRADGLPHLAVVSKSEAVKDFLDARPWNFREICVNDILDSAECSDSAACSLFDAECFDSSKSSTESSVNSSVADSSTKDSSVLQTRVKLQTISQKDVNSNRLYSIYPVGNPSYEAPCLRYAFSSYATLGQLRELNPITGEDRLLKKGKILGDFDENRYAERRIWIIARDGERVPVSLVWNRDTVANTNAMFITAYGAYEISSDPAFGVARLSLLDRGVLYAQVHVRGGGEMGRAWYEQGRRRNKKHTFEDFIDATYSLQEQGYASCEQTVANGGSAGGLLMGAVANMAPNLYSGIEADVPFVDSLTTMLDTSLPLTVTEWDEWGDPLDNVEDYKYMKSYSPYENIPEFSSNSKSENCENVKNENCGNTLNHFPKILITTSMNDTRVLVTEPIKWLARLQESGIDAIAYIQTDGGHGGTSGRYNSWKEVSYENAWCLDAMKVSL